MPENKPEKIDEQEIDINEAYIRVLDFFQELAEALKPVFNMVIEAANVAVTVYKAALMAYPNKRVLYLAMHGNTRVKKKNLRKIIKWIEREAKRARK